MNTFNYLMAQALLILNAKLKKENTAKRVGGLFRDILLFIQNAMLGMILKGELANEAAIKAISNPTKGDTYKAVDTGHYWCYDGSLWNDIGEIIPGNTATKEELAQIESNINRSEDLVRGFTIVSGGRYDTNGIIQADTRFEYIEESIPIEPNKNYIYYGGIWGTANIVFLDENENVVSASNGGGLSIDNYASIVKFSCQYNVRYIKICRYVGSPVGLGVMPDIEKNTINTVASDINEFTREVIGSGFYISNFGFWLDKTNNIRTNTSLADARHTNYFKVKTGDIINYSGSYGNDAVGLIFLDSNNNIVSYTEKVGLGEIIINIDVPENAVLCRASSLSTNLSLKYLGKGIEWQIDEVKELLSGFVVKTPYLFLYPAYIQNDGQYIPKSDWLITDFLDVNSFIEATVYGHTRVSSLAYYTQKDYNTNIVASNMVLGSGWHTINKKDLKIPEGAKYIVLSTSNNSSIFPFPDKTMVEIYNISGLLESVEQLEADVTELKNRELSVKLTPKFMHMSFDDCINVFADITNNADTYTSIFDNPFFGELKRIHDEYGMVFSLYCFMNYNGWLLSDTTTKFASEFTANAEWLKFGFHSRDGNNYAGATAQTATTDYNEFISIIIGITGSTLCIDRAVRLQNFAGSLAACTAMRDCACGQIGFLSADDSRNSYYLTSEQSTYINTHERINDVANYLLFFKSEKRLEGVSNISTWLSDFLTKDYINMSNDLVLFTHEINIYPAAGGAAATAMVSKIESCAIWAVANGYRFDFPMNVASR